MSCLDNAASGTFKVGRDGGEKERPGERNQGPMSIITRHCSFACFLPSVHSPHDCWCWPCACVVPRAGRLSTLFLVRTVSVHVWVHRHIHIHTRMNVLNKI